MTLGETVTSMGCPYRPITPVIGIDVTEWLVSDEVVAIDRDHWPIRLIEPDNDADYWRRCGRCYSVLCSAAGGLCQHSRQTYRNEFTTGPATDPPG